VLVSADFVECKFIFVFEQISDFGLSVLKEYSSLKSRNGHQLKGTVSHVAPELLKDVTHRVNEKTDIYSLAIFMWELLTQKCPYRGT
jgi:Protein kinase domain